MQWLEGRCIIRLQSSDFKMECKNSNISIQDLIGLFLEPAELNSVLSQYAPSEHIKVQRVLKSLVDNRVLLPVVDDRGVKRPQLLRSVRRIEVDITWACDASCLDCDRSCTQAPTQERMTIEQISRFVGEAIDRSIQYDRIFISGGEPTLHPDVLDILEIFSNYKFENSPATEILLYTNGLSPRATEVLKKRPPGILVENSMKSIPPYPRFHPFNLANGDRPEKKNKNWHAGCAHSDRWAMGLCRNGYYQCPIAGAIDRIVGFDIGRKELPDADDHMFDLMEKLCPYCGLQFPEYEAGLNSKQTGWTVPDTSRIVNDLTDKDVQDEISLLWKDAYSLYKKAKPVLNQY